MATISKKPAVKTIARISQGHHAEFRVMLSTWKGETKIEFGNFSSVISGIYFQAGPSIALPIEKIDQLIDALDLAKKRGG